MLKIEQTANQYLVHFYNVKKFNVLIAHQIEDQLLQLVQQSGTKVSLNFTGVSFIDSVGFEVLLNIIRQADLNDSKLILMNVGDEAMEIIKLVELDKVLEIV